MSSAQPVLDLIEAFRRSKTMFTAVDFGIFDELLDGPKTAFELSRKMGGAEDPATRFLDACVSLGLLRREGEAYANTEMSAEYLTRSSPRTLAGYILYSDKILYAMWGNLRDCVREGTNRWAQTFGLDGPLFTNYFDTDEKKRTFLLGMHGMGQLSSPAIAAAFDLSRFRRIVDLGGATGHLAMAVAERYPAIEAAVFDLAPVIEFAREFTAGTRVERIAGDFFTDPLPPADLYSLGRILHDWGDEKIRLLLGRIHAALPAGGALLICERLLDEDLRGPAAAHMQSLNMMIATEGRERSFGQYAALLEEAGFSEVKGERTGTVLDAVLALKN
jgi:acetylserotonin N-methyltransferase